VPALPAVPAAALAGTITRDPVAHALDAAALLDGEVRQLAGFDPLVAHDRRLGLESGPPAQPAPAQDPAHDRDRPAAAARDPGPDRRSRREASMAFVASSASRVELAFGTSGRGGRPRP
jgi:hypothetical protein